MFHPARGKHPWITSPPSRSPIPILGSVVNCPLARGGSDADRQPALQGAGHRSVHAHRRPDRWHAAAAPDLLPAQGPAHPGPGPATPAPAAGSRPASAGQARLCEDGQPAVAVPFHQPGTAR
ncbi:hypothetical protein G6F22_019609 [Rhizopus arrhizus]|nr:hypothetical protein G6F22_019609 [Rhizopus arrhizus]